MVDGLHRVVITGLGAVTPIGNTVQDYWNGLTSGSNGVDAITLFDASAHACRFAAEVKDFDPSGFIEPKEAKRWDRFCKFGVVAAKQAVANAGLDINDANGSDRHDHRLRRRRSAHDGDAGPCVGGQRPWTGEPVHGADDDPQHGHRPCRHCPGHQGSQLRGGHRMCCRLQCCWRCLPAPAAGQGRRHGVRWRRISDHASPGSGRLRQRQGPVLPQRRSGHGQPSVR